MKTKLLLTLLFLLGLSLAVAAQDDFPDDILEDASIDVSDPELVLEIEFDDEDDWEFYEDDTGSVEVDDRDEVYVIQDDWSEDRAYLWGQDPEGRIFGNIVIQVETEQLSNEDNNGYGVMCRADPSNNGYGYIFYISGDGFAVIYRSDEDGVEQIFEWEANDAINQGEDENELIIVCVDEYLGFFVNGELVGEAEDDVFDEGVIAFAASTFEEDEEIEVAYDNLLVWEVESDGNGGRTSTTGRGNDDDSDIDTDDLEDDIADMLEDGDVEISLEDVQMVETWEDFGEWDELDGDDFTSDIDDDTYVIENESDASLVWGLNRTEHEDVVITVEMEQLSDGESNGFGLMCRVDSGNLEDGYSFLVRPNGTYAIGYWDDLEYTSLLDNDFEVSSDIDEEDSYTMTVVCVGEYLALYIDGELIDELEDDTYDEGYAGVAAVSFSDDGVEVAFDNLVIWEADD